MQFDRIQIVQYLRDQHRSNDAELAHRELPVVVDTDREGGRLAQLGISGQQLIDALGQDHT